MTTMANYTFYTLSEYIKSTPVLRDAARVCYVRSSKFITDKNGEQRLPLFLVFVRSGEDDLITSPDGTVVAIYVSKAPESAIIKAIDSDDTSHIQVSILLTSDGRPVSVASIRPDYHLDKKNNWKEFKKVLNQNHIAKLYHFTDRDNLESIIKNGGLYSWADCLEKGITIAKPGGSDLSHNLDRREGLQNYVRVSFVHQHPMMYVAMNEGRISNPVILEIDPEVVYLVGTKYADRNATRNGARVGSTLEDFKSIHFQTMKARTHFDLDVNEQPYYQAEVLVNHFIPLEAIINIGNFGIPIPAQPQKIQTKLPYTAQITRSTPTAFIFLIDQSVSMRRQTTYNGEQMSMSEAVARIVNNQINELVLRCIKTNEVRHYYDIAAIGYSTKAYSAWNGELEGRDFVTPQELKEHPFKVITTKKETRTRKGIIVKEVQKVQWLEARGDGSWTHVHEAFARAKSLLTQWMEEHHNQDCYPPTIINITDGEFNGTTKENVLQLSNEMKSMFTNDGNVLLFNIHVSPNGGGSVVFPIDKTEINGDKYGETLYEMSSLLPLRYNQSISEVRKDNNNERHVAMAANADMSTLIQLMDIGTPTNISQSK